MVEGFALHEIICDEQVQPCDYRFLDVNPAFEAMTGLAREQVIDRSVLQVLPGTEPSWIRTYGEVALTGTSVRFESYAQELDKHFEITAYSPKHGQFATIFADITDRIKTEEQLRRIAVELEQRNEELKQFAYIVSHDMRGPLVNLKGFSGELQNACHLVKPIVLSTLPHIDDDQREAVVLAIEHEIPEAIGFIESAVSRMDQFINAILKLSRLGSRELEPEPIDMQDLVQSLLQSLTYQIEQRQAKVTVEPLPQVVADHLAMELIMGNLLSNAVRYLDPERPGEIEVSAQVGPDETVLLVRDNGRGIAEEDTVRIFAPFRRAGKQEVPGEGMGLAYVQTLIRRHQGRIWFESELGKGTTFFVTIPHHLAQESEYA